MELKLTRIDIANMRTLRRIHAGIFSATGYSGGTPGPAGPAGADGVAGPNVVDTSTTTTITGIIKGDGLTISQASSPTDYIDTLDSRLSDARNPTTHTHPATDITTLELDGDRLPAISATKKGGVPMTGTPSGKYLKDDGTWATVVGGSGLSQQQVMVVTSVGF